MTTTPTSSPELPDLDKLEALADAMPEHLQLKGWYVAAPSFGQQHVYADNFKGQGRQHIASLPVHKTYFAGLAEFIAAFDPPTVKRLIALARRAKLEPIDSQASHADMVKRNALLRQRHDLPVDRIPAHAELVRLQEENARLRAQPEGEAPQAKDTPESMAQSNARFAIDGAIQYGRENRNEPPSTDHWLYEYWNIGRQLAQLGATGWDNVTPAPAATLSPLCGAQHAESGKEVAPDMLWQSDDSERFAHGPDEFANDYAADCLHPGEEEIVDVDCATRASKRTMSISVVDKGDDDYRVEWKWVERAAQLDGGQEGSAT